MKRLLARILVALLVFSGLGACSPNSVRAKELPEQTVTVCDLNNWGKAMAGTRVRVEAEYFTVLHHGAFLLDRRCPKKWLQVGTIQESADKSLRAFIDFIAIHDSYYAGKKFKINVSGIFEWDNGRIINAELPPDRQLHVPPHGEISLLKVWSFAKPNE